LIDSVLKANDKGKIKIKKIEDNTSADAEIIIHLSSGVSPDKTIDALYAFTDCEVSISPNSSIIDGERPVFLGVSEILRANTDQTVFLLRRELEIRLAELEAQWHFATLEKIFIQKEMYIDFKNYSDKESLYEYLYKSFEPFKKQLIRDITDEDLQKLTQIPMIRITRFDSSKADDNLLKIEDQIKAVKENLANLVEYAIDYFKNLKKNFGEGKERKTEIKTFENISASKVIIANKKLFVDYDEGFIGYGLRKVQAVSDCSDIDDIICFFKTGKMLITKITDKKFVGKDLVYANVWKRGDKRTIYHVIYRDGTSGPTMMKRFYVNSITRDTEYDLTKGNKSSKVLYFSANPNGEREIITVALRPRPHLKKLKFDVDLGDLIIKGRKSVGNRVTKELVQKVLFKETGGSTLAARKIWFDDVVGRLNDEGRGQFLGDFKGEDKLLSLYSNGAYRLSSFDLSTRFEEDMIHLEKWIPSRAISVVYYDGKKELYYVKRFECEVSSNKRVLFISDGQGSSLEVISTAYKPEITIVFNKHLKATKNLPDAIMELSSFIDVKGMRAQGNQLTKLKVKEVLLNHSIGAGKEPWPVAQVERSENGDTSAASSTIEEAEVIEELVEESSPIKKVSKKEVKNDLPKETAKQLVKTQKEPIQKAKNSKDANKKTTKAKKEDNTADKRNSQEESPSNTIEWDLSDDKSDDQSDDQSDENDQMTLF
jgi:topoisomerase-4 subunit A